MLTEWSSSFHGAVEAHDGAQQDPAPGPSGVWTGHAPDTEPDSETERVQSPTR